MLAGRSALFCDMPRTRPRSGTRGRGNLPATLRVLRPSGVSAAPAVERKNPGGLGVSCVCVQPNFSFPGAVSESPVLVFSSEQNCLLPNATLHFLP